MPLFHIALILILVSIWGFNFVVIKIGLEGISPLLLCSARFFLTSIPLIFFVKRPKAPLMKVASYGLIMFAIQFSFLFIGMKVGITPGLASLLLQIQVFFTIALAIFLFKEKLHIYQAVGALLAAGGVGVVWHYTRGEISLAGFTFVIGAALFWSIGNAIAKTIPKTEIIPLVIWGSFVAWPPLLALALIVDGTSAVIHSIYHIHIASICAISYIGYLSTLFGYIAWNWLLLRHPLATIAPYTLLVPIVALISSSLYLGESFPFWKFGAAVLVLSGLVINTVGSRFLKS